jgi:alpha-ketoglutarate-dependent 2,4-dichlorophenoxyacetate dioxygenase
MGWWPSIRSQLAGAAGFTNFNDEERREMPPVPRVVVRTLPESGRKSLYLASHAGRTPACLPEGRA